MNRLILCTLILFPFVFSSCGKQIESTVFDNFGKPLEGAKVEIFNTKFEAKTNSSGKYAIDYAAGEVFIRFTHDNYLKREDGVYISEKQTYPFKDVRLIKIPTEAGFYIASDELSDYIKLKSERNVTKNILKAKAMDFAKLKL